MVNDRLCILGGGLKSSCGRIRKEFPGLVYFIRIIGQYASGIHCFGAVSRFRQIVCRKDVIT